MHTFYSMPSYAHIPQYTRKDANIWRGDFSYKPPLDVRILFRGNVSLRKMIGAFIYQDPTAAAPYWVDCVPMYMLNVSSSRFRDI